MLMDELGLKKGEIHPLFSATTTFIAFLVVGAIPLFPFIVSDFNATMQFTISCALAGLVFLCIGIVKGIFVSRTPLYSGISTLVTGTLAATLAFLAGYIVRELIGLA